MITKLIIISIMCLILGALISSFVFLIRDKNQTKRGVGALTFRIGLSVCLFLFLFLAFKLHWIAPHDLQTTPINERAPLRTR